MKKIILYCFFIISGVIMLLGASPRAILFLEKRKVLTDPNKYGSLYRMCDLRLFKENIHGYYCPPFITSHSKLTNVNLYLLGDSYTEYMNSTHFAANHYNYTGIYSPWVFPALDTQKKNILIIESTERHMWNLFRQPATDTITLETPFFQKRKKLANYFKEEGNLTYILTFNSVACFFKEIKAWINLTVFNNIDNNVSLSKDRKYLFLKATTDSTLITSSFYTLSDAQIDTMVKNINTLYHHFLTLGFTRVYMSIIPSPVSLIEPNESNYNHLIERLETSPKVEIPFISIYKTFERSPSDFYYKSDPHWNCEGRTLWLQKVDSVLYSISVK